MKISVSAAYAQLRNVTFCGLVTFTLAACGAGGESSSSGAAAADSGSNQTLVQPSVGMIDRAPAPGQSASGSNSDATTAAGTVTTTVAATDPTPGSSGSDTSGGSGSSAGSGAATASTGTATLDWTPPTQNTDGSVLTDLAGYTVYYGTTPGNLTQSVKIANPGLTAYTMSDLPSGTWYFAISSYTASGVESVRSVVISARI